MLQVPEQDIDRVTELFYRIGKGEVPQPIVLAADYPQNEVRQVVEYANKFVADYKALAAAMSAVSRGDLDVAVPAGRMQVVQSFKNLHANLRHLTWKTQQIAGGDLTQHVDFMGDFSHAFNRMTEQLREAFARIDRQNKELASANERMKRDLDAAARVQRTLLPEGFPQVPGWEFAWTYRPCDELAGDALNIVRINDRLIGIFLLDVSGHGVPAALLSVTATRSLHPRGGGESSVVAGEGANPEAVAPAQVAAKLNSLYPMESNGDHYFTMVYGLLDVVTRRIRFTVAGHPGPIILRHGQPPERIEASGFPIGMIPGAEYEEWEIELQAGDRLFLHSDGVTEELSPGDEEFGDPRLLAAIDESRSIGLDASLDAIVKRVVDWRGAEHLKDDVSVLAVAAS